MPLYDYECTICHDIQELLVTLEEKDYYIICELCNTGFMKRKLNTTYLSTMPYSGAKKRIT